MSYMRRIGTNILVCVLVFAGLVVMIDVTTEKASAGTSIPAGNVSGIWNATGSPYWIEGNIVVPTGSTLNIWDGTEVRFNGSYRLLVDGTLIANGTAASNVRFTTNDTVSPAKGNWTGIIIDTGLPAGSGSFEYCNFSYAHTAVEIRTNGNMIANSSFYENYNGTFIIGSTPFTPATDNIIENSTFISNINAILLSFASDTSILYNEIHYNTAGITGDMETAPVSELSNIIGNNITNNENGTFLMSPTIITGSPSMNVILNNNYTDNNISLGLVGSQFDLIADNNITNNSAGAGIIGLPFMGVMSSDNTIINNNINDNTGLAAGLGLTLIFSSNDDVSSNDFYSNNQGIFLMSSDNTTVEDNTLMLNGLAVSLLGSNDTYFENNTVDGNGFGIQVIQGVRNTFYDNTVINSMSDNVLLVAANYSNVILNNLTASINGNGLNAFSSNNLTITDNTLIGNQLANIELYNIMDTEISENDILFSSGLGLNAINSNNLTVANNTVLSNSLSNLNFDNITDSRIRDNNASLSINQVGLNITTADNLMILNNTLLSNPLNMALMDVSNSDITDNNASFSTFDNGIWLYSGSWNDFYDNVGYGNNRFGMGLGIVNNITVENNTYSGSLAGMVIFYGNNSLVSNSSLMGNNVGIAIQEARTNTVRNTNMSLCELGGFLIHSIDITLDNITVINDILTGQFGIGLENASYSNVNGSYMTGNGVSGLYLNNSLNNTITNNTIIGNMNGTIADRYSSLNNFINNNVSSNILNGYLFNDSSNANTLSDEDIKNNLVGIGVSGSSDVFIVNSTVMSLQDDFALYNDGHATALNVTSNFASFYGDALSDLTVQWFLDAMVVNSTLNPIPAADLFVEDIVGTEIYNSTTQGTTDISGYVRWIVATEYIESQSAQILYTPHNATAWKNGKTGFNESVVDTSMEVLIVIDTTAPTILDVDAQPNPQEVFGFVNITVNVTDSSPITEVWVNITDPVSGSTNTSIIANYDKLTSEYYYDTSYNISLGTYDYNAWVSDSNSNWANESGSFVIEDRTSPVITMISVDPDPQLVGGNVNITTSITDNFDTNLTITASLNITDPLGGTTNTTMILDPISGKFYYNATYTIPGQYNFTIWANDTSDNWDSATANFNVTLPVDDQPPEIINLVENPDPQEVNGIVNITANITDNVGVDEVWIDIDGIGNFSMSYDSTSDKYYYEQSYDAVDTYTYTIWANDTSDNWNSSSSTFTIQDTIPPVSNPGSDKTVAEGTEVTFDGSGSSDNSGIIVNYTWTIYKNQDIFATIYGDNPTFTFSTSGNYTVTLVVTDGVGLTDQASITVNVTEEQEPPGPEDGTQDWWWIIVVAIVVFVIIILTILPLKFRKKPEEDEEPSPSSEPSQEDSDVPATPPELEPEEITLEEPE